MDLDKKVVKDQQTHYFVITKYQRYSEATNTFKDESENPPATSDPSCDIDAQFSLQRFTGKLN